MATSEHEKHIKKVLRQHPTYKDFRELGMDDDAACQAVVKNIQDWNVLQYEKSLEGETPTPPSDPEYTQLCVINGLNIKPDEYTDFTRWILAVTGCKVKPCEVVITKPDVCEHGIEVPDTGGRCDFLFYVHKDDVSAFAAPKFQVGARWWEDVVKYNDNSRIYPKEILLKYATTW